MKLKNLIYLPLILACNSCAINPARLDPNKDIIRANVIDEKNFSYGSDYEIERERILQIAQGDYKQVIRELSSPLEASIYCTEYLTHGGIDIDSRLYGYGDYWASFRKIHERKIDDCDGGALAAAAILSDDGFQPYVLVVNAISMCHVVFLYMNQNGKYGSIGINKADNNPPLIDSVEELAKKLGRDMGCEKINNYEVFDIGCVYPDFIDNEENNNPE